MRLLPVLIICLRGVACPAAEEPQVAETPWYRVVRHRSPTSEVRPAVCPAIPLPKPVPSQNRNPSRPNDAPRVQTIEGPEAHSAFGHSVDGAGDVNGDGFGDIVGSAFRAGRLAGEVRVYLGGPDGVSASRSWRFEGRVPAGELGHQVAGLGDVNGDGYDDLLVGDPQFFQEPDFNGRLFAFYGGPEGLPEVPSWEYSPDLTGPGNIGFSVGAAGDVNGDGYADAIAGAYVDLSPPRPGRLPGRGRARVFLGGPTGLGSTPIWEAAGDQEQSFFAYSVQGVGDLNGDGYAEVAVGEIQFSAAAPKVGRVLVYYGSPQGPLPMADWSIQGIQAFQEMGVSIHRAGDVNGDGYDDLVLAANRTSNGQNGEGLVLVFHGSPRGLGLRPDWSFESNQVDFLLGHSAALANPTLPETRIIKAEPGFSMGPLDMGWWRALVGGLPANPTGSNSAPSSCPYPRPFGHRCSWSPWASSLFC